MWRSGNFAKSMFYFALKIKRPEVASGTYFRPPTDRAGPETSAQWIKRAFDCGQFGAS
jgi:hypothetical protein